MLHELELRKGILRLDRAILDDIDLLQQIQSEVLIYDGTFMYAWDAMEFHARSKHFDEVDMGEEVPKYEPEFKIVQHEEDNFTEQVFTGNFIRKKY